MPRFVATVLILLLASVLMLLASSVVARSPKSIGNLGTWLEITSHFVAWLSISIGAALAFSTPMSALRRSSVIALLFLFGLIVTLLPEDTNWLKQQLIANPGRVASVHHVSLVSILALLLVPAWLSYGTTGANSWLRITTLQVAGFTAIFCLFFTVMRTHGSAGFAQISTVSLLALLGTRLSKLVISELTRGETAELVAIVIGIMAMLILNHLGIGRWIRTPVLATFTISGIGQLILSVSIAVALTVTSHRH